jgi:hypothetical protein
MLPFTQERIIGVKRDGLTFAGLMRESTDCVESALRGGTEVEQMVAMRIVETPEGFHRWENEHAQLMRGVADYSALRNQVGVLKQTTHSLIHGKALFEYLKKREVRGEERSRLMHHFYPNRGYTFAMVAAHGSYLRKTCSFLCTNHVGAEVVRDDEFLDPLQQYEDLYSEYFELYCRLTLPGGIESAAEKSLLPLIKHQLGEWRWAILNPREATPLLRRESRLRRPTGDTQQLRSLKWSFKRRD